MTEHDHEPDPLDDGLDVTADDLRTGDARVDAVLDSLQGLEDRPVEEHVGVFERAHEELRRALDAPGESASGLQPDTPPDV